uniref:Uncharacterized protein n=1 Tax=Clonostachys compactiuscula TaxID=122660 RepID=A0A8F2BR32_9HYPO|nr:hypothetical protein [Clonostachys compactiuscula]
MGIIDIISLDEEEIVSSINDNNNNNLQTANSSNNENKINDNNEQVYNNKNEEKGKALVDDLRYEPAKEGETFESRYKGTYMDRLELKAFEYMREKESKWLDTEKAEFEETGILPDVNYHDKVAEFRKNDFIEEQAIIKKLEKVRLQESPEDIGSSVKKRHLDLGSEDINKDDLVSKK